MWWEIIPSFTIICTVMAIPALAGRAVGRVMHDGNPTKRCYTTMDPYAVSCHNRDTQHGKSSFWQKYVKDDKQGNATVYKSNTLADL